jgi:hypothetical protein
MHLILTDPIRKVIVLMNPMIDDLTFQAKFVEPIMLIIPILALFVFVLCIPILFFMRSSRAIKLVKLLMPLSFIIFLFGSMIIPSYKTVVQKFKEKYEYGSTNVRFSNLTGALEAFTEFQAHKNLMTGMFGQPITLEEESWYVGKVDDVLKGLTTNVDDMNSLCDSPDVDESMVISYLAGLGWAQFYLNAFADGDIFLVVLDNIPSSMVPGSNTAALNKIQNLSANPAYPVILKYTCPDCFNELEQAAFNEPYFAESHENQNTIEVKDGLLEYVSLSCGDNQIVAWQRENESNGPVPWSEFRESFMSVLGDVLVNGEVISKTTFMEELKIKQESYKFYSITNYYWSKIYLGIGY